ncbi:hypothetical protein ANANG_G00098620 [Anguilla anguilla]|uniref:SH3 domain-containing protein n=1 Tax=Anguilla anguilla TaxID=7936 RepID=A0A9D3MGT0_ANGAN|nr:hypothetical protein ANANG_G00098620 [Anguilla anguilla]
MAEARLEAEEEPREFRELVILRNRRGQSNPATDHSERNKPERRLSQGPLSSLRAAIKRTSSRTSSQGDNARDRRRPEITIVSAEPLAANAWFPGASGGFTPAPPPAQPIWGGNIPAAAQPPPSYDQVIKEKTQEQVPPPVATPRHSTTIATQTDFLLEAGSECTASPQPAERKGFSVKRALKPPRPSLPKAKPEPDDTAVLADQPCPIPVEPFPVRTDTTSATNQQAAEAQPLPDHSCVTQSDPSPPLPVLCDETVEPFDHGLVSVDSPSEPIEADPASSRPQRPIPLPRFKPNLQSISRERPQDPSDDGEQSEEDDIMSVSHSQRNIKAKIHAFEQQSATDAGDEAPLVKPEPRPRTQYSKPAVAAKPSFTRRPSGLWEQINASGSSMEQGQKEAVTPPTPAPRPLLPKASTEAEISDVPETQAGKVPLIPLALANYATPLLPSRPSMENGNGDRPVAQIPVKPQRSVTFGTNPPSASRKPTMIRVPSKADENESQEAPPALPFQRPIGGVPLPVMRKPSLISRPTHPPPVEPSNPEGFSFQPASTPVLSLPPRPVGSKVLPPRPPPAKAGPSRPPTWKSGFPQVLLPGRMGTDAAPTITELQGVSEERPVQPPRPNPGHPLYNKYTLEIPHAIAEFDYNGSNTGELSFQKNEVLVLLEQMDRNTFECQVGDAKGPVQKSYLKIITPLSSASSMPSHQVLPSAEVRRGSSGLQAQALHDFTPESPEELALKAGDLVSMVERVDDEWYRGTARGSTGVFPVSFVRVLSTIPAPPSGQKAPPAPASVSGPRCVALFDFEGESSDELSFAEGDVIGLKEYIGEEWARGELNGYVGLFPLTFVEVVEDLPAPPPAQQNVQAKIPLPGMVSASKNHESARPTQLQSAPAGAEWGRAQYDFIAETDNDLPFQQGAVIQIMERVDAEWCRGRLDGRDGYFPATFVIPCPAPPGGTESQSGGGGGRARALFDFVPETEEELSLKAGDIITGVESIDDEWLLGELYGRRGLVPKNYVKVL